MPLNRSKIKYIYCSLRYTIYCVKFKFLQSMVIDVNVKVYPWNIRIRWLFLSLFPIYKNVRHILFGDSFLQNFHRTSFLPKFTRLSFYDFLIPKTTVFTWYFLWFVLFICVFGNKQLHLQDIEHGCVSCSWRSLVGRVGCLFVVQ